MISVKKHFWQTFHFKLHGAALAASLIASLAVVQAAVFGMSPTDFQGGHRVGKGHLVPITCNNLWAVFEPVDVYLRRASHLALKQLILTGAYHR